MLEFIDKTGRTIYLTKERWSHISTEHPEVSDYLKNFEDILSNPTKITNYDNTNYYYKYSKERKSFLLVLVKYLNGKGFIITSYFVRNIK